MIKISLVKGKSRGYCCGRGKEEPQGGCLQVNWDVRKIKKIDEGRRVIFKAALFEDD